MAGAARQRDLDRLAAQLARHAMVGGLHLDSLVIETLTGAVNGVNKNFFCSRVPRAGMLLVVFRRMVLRHGDGITSLGYGRLVILDDAPMVSGGQTDVAPTGIYVASNEPAPELTATTMDALPRPRRQQEVLPIFENRRRPPRAA